MKKIDYKSAHEAYLSQSIDLVKSNLKDEGEIEVFEFLDLKDLFKPREIKSNKGSFGRRAIIGGSLNFIGSIHLSLEAYVSLITGAGYSSLIIPRSLKDICLLRYPEITYDFLDDEDGFYKYNPQDIHKLMKYDSISIGMGMGVSKDVYYLIRDLLTNYEGKLVIDADGLNSLSEYGIDILSNHKCKVILTPHLKEFSRLIKKDVKDIEENIKKYGEEFSKKYDVVLNLKSYYSFVFYLDKISLTYEGSTCLAKGGSGDVLSGITTAFLARCDDIYLSTSLANLVLALASEICESKEGQYSPTASDVIKCIKELVYKIEQA